MRPYSFANTIVLVNGVEISGWADGDDAIDIERLADSATHKIGAGGQMAVALSTDKSGSIKFSLLQTSASNRYLNTLLQRQEAGAATFMGLAVQFQDLFRQDLGTGSAGYIRKPPGFKRGRNINNQMWELIVESLVLVYGDTGDLAVLGQ